MSLEINKKLYYKLVVSLFLLAIFIRIYKFGIIPLGFNQDGAMAAVDALALSKHGTDRFGMWLPVHFTAWDYGQMSVLLSYLMVPFIKILGLTVLSARLPMLIVSLLGIYVLYKLIKDIYGDIPALIVLFVIAINPWHIMQSRWALDCNLFPHFILFSIYFLYKGLKKDIFLYISMFFFAMTMYSYGISFFTIPILLVIIFLYLLKKKQINMTKSLICLAIYLLFAWPVITVMIINYFKLPTISTRFFTIPFFENSVRMNDLIFFTKDIAHQLTANITNLLGVAFVQTPDLPWNSITDFGPMYLFNTPFLCIGIYFTYIFAKQKNDNLKSVGNILILFWLFISIFAGVVINGVNINRINIIFYPLIILSGLGIYSAVTHLKKKLYTILIISTYLIVFTMFSISYFKTNSNHLGDLFFYGFGNSVISAEQENKDTVYITTKTWKSENSRQEVEILTMFYLKIDLVQDDLKYKYINYTQNSEVITNATSEAIFVFYSDEIGLFPEDRFIINCFENYGTAMLK